MYTMAVGECWKGALFLSERTNNNSFITVEGQKRLEQWKKLIQCEYLTLDECLSIEGINSRQLCQMLSSKEEYLENEQTFRLDWVEGLNEIISGKYDDVHIPEVPINPFFYSFLKRFLQYAYQNLIKKLMTTKQVTILTPQIVQNLLTELANELSSISTRTLVLELNVARVSGRLHGNTSEDRLKYYVDVLLKDKDYLARLLQEYSVLSRLLITRTKFWIRNILDLIGRFGADFNTLEGFFGKGKLGKLARIQIQGIGDSHHEGRSVGILTFASGTKLVYKPRSLEVDLQFNDLIQTINDWGLRYPLKTAVTFNRGNYGWMEFIKEIECNTPQEIKKFYWRMGSYLAILYTLNAVDFHYENIIAAGEFPIIVDLETLLHNNSRFQSDNTAYQNAQDLIRQSVLSIGLLPGAFWEKGNRKGIDMSGLGGQEGQVHPIKSPVLTDFYKDTAHIKGKYLTLSLKNNQARYKGRVINSEDFMDDIIIGFTETYQLLKNHKEMLTTEIKKFANIEVRQILRPTQRYSSLRNISFHPDFLRDGLDREMILHKLWIDYSVYRDLKQVICSEKKDMLLGDIPIFNSKPGQRHLLDSRKKVLYNFFPYSALDASLKKINNLSLVDCEQQVRYIRSAMCRLKESSIKNSEEKIYSIKYCNSYNRNAFLKEAIHIGEYILDTAITGNYKGEKDLCWIGYGSINDQESESGVSPVGTSLYEGVLGIALFLGYLAEVTGRKDFKCASQQALVPVSRQLGNMKNIGAFTGIASTLYVTNHLSRLWKNDYLLQSFLQEQTHTLKEMIPKDERLDMIGGVAGCSIVLLQLYEQLKDPKLLELAKQCGDRLLQTVQRMQQGMGWKVLVSEKPLAGFSHGVSGMAWTLFKLTNVTGNKNYQLVAEQALTFERTLFSRKHLNWYDLRMFNGKSNLERGVMPVAWCHGAPGIALSRLLISPYKNDSFIQKEIEVGIATTLQRGFGINHSLCHGDLGNLDILIFAANQLNDNKLVQTVNDYSQSILQDIKNRGWVTGLHTINNESPSLMLGLAGIGMGLLKIWSPNYIPSILRLQAPAV